MKKIFFAAIIAVMIFAIPVSAANVGDKISEAVYTDIVAYINNYPMPAYVIDSYAVIVAEDLRDYCCDVVYDEETRSLNITKAGEGASFANKLVYKPNRETGEFYTDVLYTDIKTYVNGNEVKSFNVNGKTMIVIDEFGKYMDGYTWDSINRAALAWIEGKDKTEFKTVTKRVEVLFGDGKAYEGSYTNDQATRTYTGDYDFDFDGIEEEIFIEEICTLDLGVDSLYRITIKIGDYTRVLQDSEGSLHKIMVCDMSLTDGVKDLMLFFGSEGGISMECFRYEKSLPNYSFVNKGKTDILLSNYSYGAFKTEFMFLDENSFTFKMPGSWNYPIKKVFEISPKDDLIYVEKSVAYYEIEKEVMERNGGNSEYEREMWKKGYIMAYRDHNGEFISLKEGEYFKVLYDNLQGYVFIEKLSGESGWIYVWGGSSLNYYFFFPFG